MKEVNGGQDVVGNARARAHQVKGGMEVVKESVIWE